MHGFLRQPFNFIYDMRRALFLFIVCLLYSSMFANTVPSNSSLYSNLNGNDTGWWGTSKAETYDIAVKIDADEFIGLDIAEIKFDIADTEGIADCKIWISSVLTLDNALNAPDILCKEVTPSDGKILLQLDRPQTISENGLYIGYSFTVDEAASDAQKKPVAIVKSQDTAGHGMWLHSSRTYKKWMDYCASSNAWIPFQLTLSNLPDRSVGITLPEEINTAMGQPVNFEAIVTNQGCSGVDTLLLSYKSSGVEGECVIACEGLPTGYFNTSSTVSVTLPPFENTINSDLKIRVAQVNGLDNSNKNADDVTLLNVWSRMPAKTPLFEEYTGTGCGYCPRGNIGIEKMTELYGDRFVAVAYHCSDIMSIYRSVEDFPNFAPAQPVAWIDRVKETDPYFGDKNNGVFSVDEVWNNVAQKFTPADINLTCRWADDECNSIAADAEISFVKPFESSDFRLIYILTADGLTGEGPDWMQGNYYSGETGRWPEDFDFLVNSGRYINNMTYDHVAVYATATSGIEGIIPSSISADQNFSHSVCLDIADAVNVDGMNLVQDHDRIHVVAAILDANTGEIVNCAKASPGNTSVGELDEESDIAGAKYYNVSGQQVSPDFEGLKIAVKTLSSGKRIVSKIFGNPFNDLN